MAMMDDGRFLQRVKEECERNLEGLRKRAELNNMSIEVCHIFHIMLMIDMD